MCENIFTLILILLAHKFGCLARGAYHLVDMCMHYAAVIKEQLTAKNSLLCNYIIVGE